jgi:hypothetical protein
MLCNALGCTSGSNAVAARPAHVPTQVALDVVVRGATIRACRSSLKLRQNAFWKRPYRDATLNEASNRRWQLVRVRDSDLSEC